MREGLLEAGRRHDMVARLVKGRVLVSAEAISAFETVPRHLFVPPDLADKAYGEHALPIGLGQTITQPANVARSVELLQLKPGAKVLEVGTGSGYQTAILSCMAQQVFSLEVVTDLALGARARLKELGFRNVSVRVFDGSYGWSEHAPFDGIVVSAAAPEVPSPLLSQLRATGKMVVPVGPLEKQRLLVIHKLPNGRTRTEDAGDVSFVPLVGRYGQPASQKGAPR